MRDVPRSGEEQGRRGIDGRRSRRRWIAGAAACAGLAVLPEWPVAYAQGEEDVDPPEDLMREHGVLKRVLLVYQEAIRRIEDKAELPADAVRQAAEIIRTFIEDYHEKLEEDYLFPRFEKAGRLAVPSLRALQGHSVPCPCPGYLTGIDVVRQVTGSPAKPAL